MDANEIVVHREQTTLGPYGAMKPKDPVGVGVHPHRRDTLARGASSGVSGLKPCAAQFGQTGQTLNVDGGHPQSEPIE